MDCDMPLKNGYEATQELVAFMKEGRIATIPIVACTAFTGDEHEARCQDCGMAGHLSKPVLLQDLKQTLIDMGILSLT